MLIVLIIFTRPGGKCDHDGIKDIRADEFLQLSEHPGSLTRGDSICDWIAMRPPLILPSLIPKLYLSHSIYHLLMQHIHSGNIDTAAVSSLPYLLERDAFGMFWECYSANCGKLGAPRLLTYIVAQPGLASRSCPMTECCDIDILTGLG